MEGVVSVEDGGEDGEGFVEKMDVGGEVLGWGVDFVCDVGGEVVDGFEFVVELELEFEFVVISGEFFCGSDVVGDVEGVDDVIFGVV